MSTLTTHLLQRIADNPRLAFYFDPLTRTMELLTEAHAANYSLDLELFRKTYYAQLKFERPHCTECVGTELLEALKALAADVEKVARDSFSTVDGNFDDDYRTEDPDGYAVWSAARAAIAKAEGRQ